MPGHLRIQRLLNPDFKDMLFALSDANVDFRVVGAYAMTAHGYPRATGDLDIWIRAVPTTAPRTLTAIANFGAPLGNVTVEDFSKPGIVYQIGVAPGRIDILTEISGGRLRLSMASLSNTHAGQCGRHRFGPGRFANEQASGRPKDIVDVQTLEEE